MPPLSRRRPIMAILGKGVRCQWGQFGMRASPYAPPNIDRTICDSYSRCNLSNCYQMIFDELCHFNLEFIGVRRLQSTTVPAVFHVSSTHLKMVTPLTNVLNRHCHIPIQIFKTWEDLFGRNSFEIYKFNHAALLWLQLGHAYFFAQHVHVTSLQHYFLAFVLQFCM